MTKHIQSQSAWRIAMFGFLFAFLPVLTQAQTPIKVLNTTDHTARVSWHKTPKAKRYLLQAKNVVTGSTVAEFRTTRTHKTITNLDSAEQYKFVVKPKLRGKFTPNIYKPVATTTLLDFTPVETLIFDTFEQTSLAANAVGNTKVEFVEGYEGYGLRKVVQYSGDTQLRANVLYYDNTDAQLMNPEAGTVEMWISPQESYHDGFTHSVLDGWTESRNMNWGISMYYSGNTPMLLVNRDYGACTRYRLDAALELETNTWYKLTFTWRGNESRFYINDEEVGDFRSETRSVVGGASVGGRVYVGDESIAIDNLMITAESPILVRDKAITDLDEATVNCPNFASLVADDTIQDTYEGINLHNFPDANTREAMKALIDVLPPAFAGETEHVALVDDEDYDAWQSPTAKGNYPFYLRTVFLRKSLFDTVDEINANAQVIFHEFGHGHIFTEQLSYGGPKSGSKRNEWVNISGLAAYVGECSNPTDFIFTDGFLTAYSSTMPDEDLAEWVGVTLNLYRTGSTFSDLLNPDSAKYSELYEEKLAFLKKYEFLTEEMYNAIATDTANSTYYTQFND